MRKWNTKRRNNIYTKGVKRFDLFTERPPIILTTWSWTLAPKTSVGVHDNTTHVAYRYHQKGDNLLRWSQNSGTQYLKNSTFLYLLFEIIKKKPVFFTKIITNDVSIELWGGWSKSLLWTILTENGRSKASFETLMRSWHVLSYTIILLLSRNVLSYMMTLHRSRHVWSYTTTLLCFGHVWSYTTTLLLSWHLSYTITLLCSRHVC